MFRLANDSFLLFTLSLTLALTLINAIGLDTMGPAKGFQVLSQANLAGRGFKYEIANAGDINNDGYEDIIIGDSSYNGNKGIAYVIYGTPQASPPPGFDFSNGDMLDPMKTGFTIKGAASGDIFGCSVSSAGDINNDSHADIIIGASGKNSGQGAVYVIYGGKNSDMKNIDLSSTLDPLKTGFMITGDAAGDQFGYSVSSAGDFDGDDYDDILIGARNKTNKLTGQTISDAGAAYVIYGRASFTSTLSLTSLDPNSTGFMISGDAAGDQLGFSVSSAGDINNDEKDDIMIAAPGQGGFRGAVYIVYGAKKSSPLEFNPLSTHLNPTSTGFTVTGYASSNQFGFSISAAGDVNGDKYADIIIGAPSQNYSQGVVYVIYGGANLQNIELAGNSRILSEKRMRLEPPSQDIIQKQEGAETNQSRFLQQSGIGSSYLTSLLPSTQGFVIVGEGSMMYFGTSVSSAGDVNGDGCDDLIIGAKGNGYVPGNAYIIYGGKPSTFSGLELASANLPQANIGYSITGSTTGGSFGSSVGSVTGSDKKMKLLVSETLQSGKQGVSYILFPSKLCSGNCEFCDLAGTCTICSTGYWLQTGAIGGLCQKCPEWCTECTSDRACQACEAGYALSSPNSLCTQMTTFYGNKRENVTKDVFDGTSIVGAALSSGSSLPINFGLVAKILRNVKYLDVTVSTELQETFISWKVNSGFLAAPKSWALKAESKPLPGVFGRYGLASTFLVNYWKPFLMTLIGLVLFAVFKGIEIVVFKGDQETLKSSIPRQLNLVASNFALTQVYSNLDDVILYFILDVRSTKYDGAFGAFSLILGVMMLLVGGMIIGAHILLLRKYQSLKSLKMDSPPTQLQRFLYKYENMKLIFNDFKDITFFTQSFLWIHVTRALLSSFIFATLFEYPLFQLILLLILNLGMIIFLFVKKSFKGFLGTFSQLFCEVVLFIANICMLGLAIMDQNESYNFEAMKNMSRAVIVLNAILLIGCAILMVLGILKSLYESYIAKKKAGPGLKSLPKLQNNRLNSEKFAAADESQLGTMSTGSYAGQYDTQDYLKTAGNQFDTMKTGGINYYGTEGMNNQIEVFDLNSNQAVMNPIVNQEYNQRGNSEAQPDSNTNLSYQADDLVNASNLNLLSNTNNNSYMRSDSYLKRRRRNNIKMPGGFQTNPKPNFETPTMIDQFQSPIQYRNNNPGPVVNNNNNYGGEFSPQGTRPHRRYDQAE